MKFEIKEDIVDGDYVRKFYVSGKEVDQRIYDSMFEEQMSKIDKNKVPKRDQIQNNKSSFLSKGNIEFGGLKDRCEADEDNCEEDEPCFFCMCRELIEDMMDCDIEEAVEMLASFVNECEVEAYMNGVEEGIESGTKAVLKHFTEEFNAIIYNDMSIQVICRDNEEEYID